MTEPEVPLCPECKLPLTNLEIGRWICRNPNIHGAANDIYLIPYPLPVEERGDTE